MKSRRPANFLLILLSGVLGIFFGVGTYTFVYAQGASYLSNDPRACVNCHIMREHYDGWQKASHHAAATCNDCHVPHTPIRKWFTKAENGFWHSKGFTFQDFHEPIRIRPKNREILNQNCVHCHRSMVSEILPAASHRADALDCIRCHSSAGHGPTR